MAPAFDDDDDDDDDEFGLSSSDEADLIALADASTKGMKRKASFERQRTSIETTCNRSLANDSIGSHGIDSGLRP